jgi:molecular chaperone DnaJ
MRTCYYKILGISNCASEEDIKRAFRMLAFRFHPDRNPEDPCAEERFREALEAYETLVDSRKRCVYDKKNGNGRAREKGAQRARRRKSRVERSFEDILEGAFGIRREWVETRRGYDLRFDLQIDGQRASSGTFEEIAYVRSVFCRHCRNGNGSGGRSTCGACHGNGEVEEPCSVRIWIPEGSVQGSRVRIPGAGDQLQVGGPAGDLVIVLYVLDGNTRSSSRA